MQGPCSGSATAAKQAENSESAQDGRRWLGNHVELESIDEGNSATGTAGMIHLDGGGPGSVRDEVRNGKRRVAGDGVVGSDRNGAAGGGEIDVFATVSGLRVKDPAGHKIFLIQGKAGKGECDHVRGAPEGEIAQDAGIRVSRNGSRDTPIAETVGILTHGKSHRSVKAGEGRDTGKSRLGV